MRILWVTSIVLVAACSGPQRLTPPPAAPSEIELSTADSVVVDGLLFEHGLVAKEYPRSRPQLEDPRVYASEDELGRPIAEYVAEVDETGRLRFHADRTLFASGYFHVEEPGEYAFTVYGHHTGGARLVVGATEILQEKTRNGTVATFVELVPGLVPITVVGRIGNRGVTIKCKSPSARELEPLRQCALVHGPIAVGTLP